jgi:hypothetical protein
VRSVGYIMFAVEVALVPLWAYAGWKSLRDDQPPFGPWYEAMWALVVPIFVLGMSAPFFLLGGQ